jgi:hypothetical protein
MLEFKHDPKLRLIRKEGLSRFIKGIDLKIYKSRGTICNFYLKL